MVKNDSSKRILIINGMSNTNLLECNITCIHIIITYDLTKPFGESGLILIHISKPCILKCFLELTWEDLLYQVKHLKDIVQDKVARWFSVATGKIPYSYPKKECILMNEIIVVII